MLFHHRWVIFKVVAFSYLAYSLLLCALMESPSESLASSPLAMHVEKDLRGIKNKLKKLNQILHCIDLEGRIHLENVDQDMMQLRKEFELGI